MAIVENTQFGRVGAFRFWCQKVLPAVYDDSLSYYELLCKVMHWLEELTEVTNTQSDAIEELQETLQQFMEGEFDSYIEEKVDEWFDENEPSIMFAIEQLQQADEDIYEYFSKYIKNLSWNCKFRTIVRDCYDTTKTYSTQGFTYFIKDDVEYIAQAYDFDGEAVLVIYNYRTIAEITRITGNYGHLNDLSYANGTIYALDTDGYVKTFSFDNSSLSYTGSITLNDPAAGIEYVGANIWYTKQDTTSIYVFKCDSNFDVIETYIIPNTEQTYIQGLSVCDDKFVIATTVPNNLIVYDISHSDYYFIGLPDFIGHCFIDEVEGTVLLPNGDLLFNTNSSVDMHLICSIFTTNLKHNVQKELETCIGFTRYGEIQVLIDEVNGSLTTPTTSGLFRLVGDAINYAKQMGNHEIKMLFKTDYSFPIIVNNANLNIGVFDSNDIIELNGIIARYSTIVFDDTIENIILNPVDLSIFTFNSIKYGGYIIESKFDIPIHTWHSLNEPDEYDDNNKKIYFRNSVVTLQDISYYRFYNCILMSAYDAVTPTSIFERTAMIQHVDA